LDSVFAQSYTHHQVIVINDGSPDALELELTLAPYLKPVIYITRDKHARMVFATQGCDTRQMSSWLFWNPDDIWLPNYLEEQVHFLREHPEYDLVYCNARFFGDSIYTGKEYMDVCPSNWRGDISCNHCAAMSCVCIGSGQEGSRALRRL
jgi:glycosyltransferase involved in cell wall biosynthesis